MAVLSLTFESAGKGTETGKETWKETYEEEPVGKDAGVFGEVGL